MRTLTFLERIVYDFLRRFRFLIKVFDQPRKTFPQIINSVFKLFVGINHLTQLVQGSLTIALCEVEIENKSNDLLVLEYQVRFRTKRVNLVLVGSVRYICKNILSVSKIKSLCIKMEILVRFVFSVIQHHWWFPLFQNLF